MFACRRLTGHAKNKGGLLLFCRALSLVLSSFLSRIGPRPLLTDSPPPPLPSPSERAFISYRKRFLGLREEGEGRARKIEGPPRLHFRNRNLKSLFLVGLSPDFPLNADVKFVPGWHHPNPEGKDVEHYSKVLWLRLRRRGWVGEAAGRKNLISFSQFSSVRSSFSFHIFLLLRL